jgi:hypothetical protein
MAIILQNPNLPNYFITGDDVTKTGDCRSYVNDYEAGKVATFPNLKIDIDHEFWAGLDTDTYPKLKKMGLIVDDDPSDVSSLRRYLEASQVPLNMIDSICSNAVKIYNQILPVYYRIFKGYKFERKKVVWRLNTIRAENMHVDAYKEEIPQHFARMFINLDNQPRIWHTSWTIDDIMRFNSGKLSKERLSRLSANELWSTFSITTFGKSSLEWWDDQPRHIAFFDPGDIWIVDSRQVSHQIFYGRRALTIDFFVPKEEMGDASKYYLAIAEKFRQDNLSLIA